MHNTVERVSGRLGTPRLAGIVANRVGRTRDNRYWSEQLEERFGTMLLPQIQLRAAIAEASGQSTTLRALGKRPGAAEAASQFDALWVELGRDLSLRESIGRPERAFETPSTTIES